jgi:hypothetical protein
VVLREMCDGIQGEDRILIAARHINNAAVLRTYASSQVAGVRRLIKVDGHFENLPEVINYITLKLMNTPTNGKSPFFSIYSKYK